MMCVSLDMFIALVESELPPDSKYPTKVAAAEGLEAPTAAVYHLYHPADVWNLIDTFNHADVLGM